jgi:hypothetical protein
MIQSWKAMKTSNTNELFDDQTSKEYINGNYHTTDTKVTKEYINGNYHTTDTPYSFMMSNKGLLMVYANLQEFYSLIAIDISSNKISGEIPRVIGDLKGLVLLNLSYE